MSLFRIFFIMALSITNSFAQDLMKERIRKLTPSKTAIYIEKGIFHNGSVKNEGELKSIRQSFNSKEGYERIVFDFGGSNIPKVYGYFSSQEKKLYLDLFSTNLAKDLKTISKTKFVEKVHFFPIEKDHVSVELRMSTNTNVDVFYLENPGRIVFDFKK